MAKKSKKKNNKQNNNFLTIISGVALGLVLVFAIISVDLVSKMGIISFGDKNPEPSNFVEVTEAGEDNMVFETLEELRGVNNLSTVLKNWADNTSEKSLMQSKDVINVLLIGLDASNSNSDVIIIASLNKNTRKIHLSSVFTSNATRTTQ